MKIKDINLELFKFKQGLTYDDYDVVNIIDLHMNETHRFSELEIIHSLNERLTPHTYNNEVRGLLENLNNDVKEYKLLYELKNLYKVLERKNHGQFLHHPIRIVLEAINSTTDEDRMSKILNELSQYQAIDMDIKTFIANLITSPEKRSNLLSGGKSEPVYSIIEEVEDGHITFIKNNWFLLSDNEIKKVLLEDYIKDNEKLRTLRNLQDALLFSKIDDEKISFRISENLTVSLSVDTKGKLYLNDEALTDETTLEALFQSSIIPGIYKNYYGLILETANNIDKFYNLEDYVTKITNIVKPYIECYAFNYKDNIYVYNCDERFGSYSFYKYESALEVLSEIKSELNYDLTYFYEDKLSKEIVVKRRLEDKEKEVQIQLEDLNFNIDKINKTLKVLGDNETLNVALSKLEKRRKVVEVELQAIKEAQYSNRIKEA